MNVIKWATTAADERFIKNDVEDRVGMTKGVIIFELKDYENVRARVKGYFKQKLRKRFERQVLKE